MRGLKFTVTAFLALLSTVAVSVSQAADIAEYEVLGYSIDGRYFAFEQFGIQDGSGFAYADIFVIDLERDRWVPGTPFRYQAADETDRVFDAREEAWSLAENTFADLHIIAPFRILAATTPMEVGGQEQALTFYRRPIRTPIDPPLTLRLDTFSLPSPNDCFGLVETAGFSLVLDEGGHPDVTLHEDARLPRSRPCPADYGLAAVVVPFDSTYGRAVALVSMYQLGFEGHDRRFLAIPFDLPF